MNLLAGFDLRCVDVAGVRIRIALAPPPTTSQARSLLLLGGRTEFIEKYADTMAELRARGFHVATLDWRGQGASDRLLADRVRGHAVDFRHFQHDLDALLGAIEGVLPRPWYGFAHSMGALILLDRLVQEPNLVAKAVLSAPFLDLAAPRWQKLVGKPAVRLARRLGLQAAFFPGQRHEPVLPDALRPDLLTSDHARFERYRELCSTRPDYLLGGVTVGWLAAVVDAFDRLAQPGALERTTTPLLILKAGNERIVCATAADRVARRLPAAEVVDFPGAEHELLWEIDPIRNAVFDLADRFLDHGSP